MFSTPLICSSMGATTVVATTSALAPGYWPCTLMIGGAISGYCATGRRQNETMPRMMNTIETTDAKIGRSMKKCEIFMPDSIGLRLRAACGGAACGGAACAGRPGRGGGRGALLLRRHLGARTRPHQPVDDHAVVGGEAGLDDAQVVDDVAQRDVFLVHRVVGTDDEHELPCLLGADGGIRHQ